MQNNVALKSLTVYDLVLKKTAKIWCKTCTKPYRKLCSFYLRRECIYANRVRRINLPHRKRMHGACLLLARGAEVCLHTFTLQHSKKSLVRTHSCHSKGQTHLKHLECQCAGSRCHPLWHGVSTLPGRTMDTVQSLDII